MTLRANIRLRLDDFELDVDVAAMPGEVTAVLGPNGAGKTTLLRCITGGLAIDEGSIELGGDVFDAPPDRFVGAASRRLGIVHQQLLLFPHLTALENVAFGPRAMGAKKADAQARAAEFLARVGLSAQVGQKPATLSGGQAQRVALARALAMDPAALLLDEPLAALDATTRTEVRRDLRTLLDDFAGPTILITHDPIDALALADRVVVIEEGRVTQTGTIAEVTSRPRSRYVADLIGSNFIAGRAEGTTIQTDAGMALTAADSGSGPVFVTIDPGAITLHRNEPEGSARNRWQTTVAHLELMGQRVRVQLGPPLRLVAEVTPAAIAALDLRESDPVWVSVKATEIASYPR